MKIIFSIVLSLFINFANAVEIKKIKDFQTTNITNKKLAAKDILYEIVGQSSLSFNPAVIRGMFIINSGGHDNYIFVQMSADVCFEKPNGEFSLKTRIGDFAHEKYTYNIENNKIKNISIGDALAKNLCKKFEMIAK